MSTFAEVIYSRADAEKAFLDSIKQIEKTDKQKTKN
jgi:hypothetical protein